MDIDSDLSIYVRDKTIEYVKAKYGESAVAGILTQTRDGVKGSIQDAAAYLGAVKGYSLLATDTKIRKEVPEEPGLKFDNKVNVMDENSPTIFEWLLSKFQDDETAIEIINLAYNLEGMLTTYGQHAAGVIIYDGAEITDYMPTRPGKNNERVVEVDKDQAEHAGLLKMDFLGLKTLNIITDTLRLIEETTGEHIEIDQISHEDEMALKAFEVFANGDTKSVFQFESPGMRKNLKKLFA